MHCIQRDELCEYIPLHYACSAGLPLDIIESMVRLGGQETVTTTNMEEENLLPLHLACSAGQDEARCDVVQFLIDQGGLETLMAKDWVGRTPLRRARDEYRGAPLDVIKLLV